MIVQSDRDLRVAYELLNIFTDRGVIADLKIVEIKRSIRSFSNQPESKTKIVCDNGIDGYIALQQLPEFTNEYDLEEANEYFRKMEVIEPTYSMYDCTGKPFTNWFKVFRRNGHWFAYHSVSFDV